MKMFPVFEKKKRIGQIKTFFFFKLQRDRPCGSKKKEEDNILVVEKREDVDVSISSYNNG